MSTRLLIVDDSALMRRQLKDLFSEAGDFDILLARNGKEAVEMNLEFQPQVVTLDVNMPEMDGLTALATIMATRPVPVVMLSSLTEKGALATFEALALGAVDYVAKPGGTISLTLEKVHEELLRKVRGAARARLQRKATAAPASPSASDTGAPRQEGPEEHRDDCLVLIGVSTGGPGTLEQILPRLPADYPFPVVVAQHMPPAFTGPFAQRMNGMCALEVVEVRHPMEVAKGHIYIAKGGADVELTVRSDRLMVLPKPESAQYAWHPSVEHLGRTALRHCDARHVIGVMLTGMGDDGASAFAELHQQGARTIAQAEDSCVVFGMPKELINRSGASLVLPTELIATQLLAWAQ